MVGGFEFRVLDTRIIAASPDATDSEQIPDIQGCVANSRYHFDSTLPLIQSRLISCQYDDSRERNADKYETKRTFFRRTSLRLLEQIFL